jgi:hypothetical protein
MAIPVGTWTITKFGPTSVGHGTLTIMTSGSAASGNLTIGGATQPLSILWDDTSQRITFTTATAPVAASFEVYEGWAFQPFPAAVPPVLLAGTFRSYSPTAPASAVGEFEWYASPAPKTKEKEKEKEKEKDKEKEHKDHKDKEKDKEIHDKLPEVKTQGEGKAPEFQMGTSVTDQETIRMLEQRLTALEQKFATGTSFIKPEERPAVGEEVAKRPDQKKDGGKAGE